MSLISCLTSSISLQLCNFIWILVILEKICLIYCLASFMVTNLRNSEHFNFCNLFLVTKLLSNSYWLNSNFKECNPRSSGQFKFRCTDICCNTFVRSTHPTNLGKLVAVRQSTGNDDELPPSDGQIKSKFGWGEAP